MMVQRKRAKQGGCLSLFLSAGLLCVAAGLAVMSAVLFSDNETLRAQLTDLEAQAEVRQQELEQLQADLALYAAEAEAAAEAAEAAEAKKGESLGKTGAGEGSEAEEAQEGETNKWEAAPPYEGGSGGAWQELYPSLYAKRAEEWVIQEKTIFLTFDDGPTVYTGRVLDTLRDKGVKGTFFIVGNSVRGLGEPAKDILHRIVDEGHSLAIHCNVHEYKRIYASVEAFLDDFNSIYELIVETTGTQPDIYRFPGGSVNNFNGSIRDLLFDEMARRGFTYYDWNATSGDSSGKATAESAYWNCVSKIGKADRVILLMHDTKKASVDALPRVIDAYLEAGYRFARLTSEDKPITL
jgi:peptidoglycan/xylan/chitin deacetylase (PgdA/CDA1 family)